MAAGKSKTNTGDISPDNSPVDNANNGVAILQNTLNEFLKNNKPIATLPNAADIQPNAIPGAPPADPVKTPEATAKQPEKAAAAQAPATNLATSVVNAILNQGQLIQTPSKSSASGSNAGGGLTDIIGKLSGGGSGSASSASGGLGKVGSAISGISKLFAMFGG